MKGSLVVCEHPIRDSSCKYFVNLVGLLDSAVILATLPYKDWIPTPIP